jgi:hypothetical protein
MRIIFKFRVSLQEDDSVLKEKHLFPDLTMVNVEELEENFILYPENERHSTVYDQTLYEMNKRVSCMIISNENFLKEEMRVGAQQDSKRLKRLFSTLLNYDLFGKEVYKNLTKSEMQENIDKFSKECQKNEYDALILVIMSHGIDGAVNTKDGGIVYVSGFYFCKSFI